MSEPWIKELFEKRPEKIKPGLATTKQAWENVNSPLKEIPCVLVGGTNGKGTTSGMLAVMLSQVGLRVGHYTSPHICSFSERVVVSGAEISDDHLKSVYLNLKSSLSESLWERLSFFELTTLMAFTVFEREKVDVAVVEVGLGGRLDATNILDPVVSVVTSIDLDHTEWLGSTLERIAAEKCGISRKNKPLFLGKGCERTPQLRQVFEGSEALVYSFDRSTEEQSVHLPGWSRKFFDRAMPPWAPSDSDYMRYNFQLAGLVFSYLLESTDPKFRDARNSVAGVDYLTAVYGPAEFIPSTFLARGQKVKLDFASFYLDVAHNPSAVKSAVGHYMKGQTPGKKRVAILSLLADKDLSGILGEVTQRFDIVVCFDGKNTRSAARADYTRIIAESPSFIVYDSFKLAIDRVKEMVVGSQDVADDIFIGGSFACVEAFREYLSVEQKTARPLQHFYRERHPLQPR